MTEADTRCYTAIGGMGLVPCLEPYDYMIQVAQAPPSTHWENHYVCGRHVQSRIMVFLCLPVEVRIVPSAAMQSRIERRELTS